MKDVLDFLIAWPLLALIYLLRCLPPRFTTAITIPAGYLAYLLGIRKYTVMSNLKDAFPEFCPGKRRQICRKVYPTFGRILGEWMNFPQIWKKISDETLIENLKEAKSAHDAGKGILFLSAHFGNWEVLASLLSQHVGPLTIVRNKLSFRPLDTLFTKLHEERGVRNILKGKSLLQMRRLLSRGQAVGMLADQNAGGEGIFIPFLGKPASFHWGPTIVALRFNVPVFTVFLLPQPGYKWKLVIERLSTPVTGNFEVDASVFMQEYARRLEKAIKAFPEYWFWFHRRWKSKPKVRQAV